MGDTHQGFQRAEGNRGAVEEIGRQPALVLITVSYGCAWEEETWVGVCVFGREVERERAGEREESFHLDVRQQKQLSPAHSFRLVSYFAIILW